MRAESLVDTAHRPAAAAAPPTVPAGRWLLVTAGVLSALNGAAHWVLPLVYPWEEHVTELYEPVRWALFATTVFFGALLVLGGALTVAVASDPGMPLRVVAWVAAGMATFWVVGAVYEVLLPFPDPVAAVALPAFSLLVAVLYLAGLWRRSARKVG